MTRRTRHREGRVRGRELLAQARHFADAGDRWLVSAAFGMKRAGGWARRELDVIGDSARAAWRTTLRVAQRMGPARRLLPAPAPRTASAGAPPSGPGGLALLSATPVEREGVAAKRAPRVPLLLRMLGELVSGYGARHYESMQDDDRFWILIDLLQRSSPRTGPRRKRGSRRREAS